MAFREEKHRISNLKGEGKREVEQSFSSGAHLKGQDLDAGELHSVAGGQPLGTPQRQLSNGTLAFLCTFLILNNEI